MVTVSAIPAAPTGASTPVRGDSSLRLAAHRLTAIPNLFSRSVLENGMGAYCAREVVSKAMLLSHRNVSDISAEAALGTMYQSIDGALALAPRSDTVRDALRAAAQATASFITAARRDHQLARDPMQAARELVEGLEEAAGPLFAMAIDLVDPGD